MPSAHGRITANRGIHSAVSFIYADEAERLAAGPFEPEDLYKLAWQDDTNQVWILTTASPAAWALVVSTISAGVLDFPCRKSTPGTIPVGDCVYAAGYDGVNDVILVESARADSAATANGFGVAIEAVDNGTGGLVRNHGAAEDVLDTSGFSVGDALYVDEATAGALRITPPAGPNRAKRIGTVVTSGNPGTVYVETREERYINYSASSLQGLGAPAAGIASEAARADHVHPAESNADHSFQGNDIENFKQAWSTPKNDLGSLGGVVNVDWTGGRKVQITMTSDLNLTFTDPPGDANLTLILIQDGTGGWNVPSIAGNHFAAEGLLQVAPNANEVTRFYVEYDSVDGAYYWTVIRNYGSVTGIT